MGRKCLLRMLGMPTAPVVAPRMDTMSDETTSHGEQSAGPVYKWVIDVRARIEPKYEHDVDQVVEDIESDAIDLGPMLRFEDTAAMQYPRTMDRKACVAAFLRSMAEEIERGDLPPGPRLTASE